jgi:hypothetical protein
MMPPTKPGTPHPAPYPLSERLSNGARLRLRGGWTTHKPDIRLSDNIGLSRAEGRGADHLFEFAFAARYGFNESTDFSISMPSIS